MCGARGAAPGPPCRDRDPLPPRVIVFKAGWVQTNVFVSPRMVLHFLQKTTRGRSGASRLVPASGSPPPSASDAIPEARGRTPPPSPSSPASRTRFNPPRCARVMARKSDARLASTAAADRCFTIMLQQCDVMCLLHLPGPLGHEEVHPADALGLLRWQRRLLPACAKSAR